MIKYGDKSSSNYHRCLLANLLSLARFHILYLINCDPSNKPISDNLTSDPCYNLRIHQIQIQKSTFLLLIKKNIEEDIRLVNGECDVGCKQCGSKCFCSLP